MFCATFAKTLMIPRTLSPHIPLKLSRGLLAKSAPDLATADRNSPSFIATMQSVVPARSSLDLFLQVR